MGTGQARATQNRRLRVDDLPDGYRPISGKRNPPANSGPYHVLLRNGMRPPEPWPVANTRWKWGPEPDDFDIVAIKAKP